jgi:transposase InsO family protein
LRSSCSSARSSVASAPGGPSPTSTSARLTHSRSAVSVREFGERFESHHVAKTKLFDYMEVFYNQQPRHSSLGNTSPAVFERTNAQQTQMS